MLYVLVYTIQIVWGISAVTPVALRAPYVDEPYHLALLGEFRHHFPAEVPFVDGTPLRYHWLVYPFLAAGTWGSGVAPIVLLKVLVPAALIALLVLGVAVAASRISGHRWAAVGSAAVLCALTPLDMMAWTDVSRPWLTTGWLTYRSPTQLLANALCPLLVVLLVGILRGAAARPRHWVATAGVMLAVAGAKSAMLPVFVAGRNGARRLAHHADRAASRECPERRPRDDCLENASIRGFDAAALPRDECPRLGGPSGQQFDSHRARERSRETRVEPRRLVGARNRPEGLLRRRE